MPRPSTRLFSSAAAAAAAAEDQGGSDARNGVPSNSAQGSSSPTSEPLAQSDANIRNFAPVARIMKIALPENAKIAKEAKECMQECVSEFISFITSEGTSEAFGCPFPALLFAQETVVVSLLSVGKPDHDLPRSVREMPTREAQNSQRRRHPVRHDQPRL